MENEMTDVEILEQVANRYGKTHTIEKVFGKKGMKVDITKLKDGQSVCWGNGKTYYFLLTELPTPPINDKK